MTAVARNGQVAEPGSRRRTHFKWEEFDALPPLMRDLMNYTPHAVGTGYVFRLLRDGAPLKVVARDAVARWRRYAREETLKLYGPTHPQVAADAGGRE